MMVWSWDGAAQKACTVHRERRRLGSSGDRASLKFRESSRTVAHGLKSNEAPDVETERVNFSKNGMA
jgi:hypothetical protein